MTEHTSEEIKNRLSNIGEAIGTIALEYIVELEKEKHPTVEEMLKRLSKGGYVKSGIREKDDKFYTQPIMVAVAESELQRFRELETENTLLKVQIEGLKKENERLRQENEQLKVQIEKMKNHTNCKFYHEWNLANVMEEPLDDLSPCQGCKNFSLWELAE